MLSVATKKRNSKNWTLTVLDRGLLELGVKEAARTFVLSYRR